MSFIKFILSLSFAVLIFLNGISQTRTQVEIIYAKTSKGKRTDSTDLRILKGDVQIRHKNTLMHCDSAIVFTAFNRTMAFGNVYINENDSVEIWCDRLNYFGNTEKADLIGNVKMTKKDLSLTTDRLDYNLKTKVAVYKTGAVIKDSLSTLSSKIGYFHSDTENSFFRDSVRLVNEKYTLSSDTLQYNTANETANFFGPTLIESDNNTIYCERGWYDTYNEKALFYQNTYMSKPPKHIEADTIYYDRNAGIGKAYGNITLTDTTQDIILYSHRADYYEKANKIIAVDRSIAINIVNGDSLYIVADTLKTLEDSSGSMHLHAFYGVIIYKSDLQGICDSLSYNRADSSLSLYTSPILWIDSNQFSGDTILIQFSNDKMKQINLIGNAFLASINDSLIYNQITGREIFGFFENDSLYQIDVNGNGHSIYYIQDDKKKYVAVNDIICSNMEIKLEKNQISTIDFLGQPNGETHPIQQIDPRAFIMEGFSWKGSLRPLQPLEFPFTNDRASSP